MKRINFQSTETPFSVSGEGSTLNNAYGDLLRKLKTNRHTFCSNISPEDEVKLLRNVLIVDDPNVSHAHGSLSNSCAGENFPYSLTMDNI